MSTTNINEWLKVVAQAGDINLLYTLIREDSHILEHIDSIPFVETPLHVAASFGQLQFATEMMRLKPSFAWKLNEQGFSPIHLAMQHGQWRMVHRLVDINSDLVRVKGREGLTPLHLASQDGDVDLLARFLFACPDSIEDVTGRSETALHVAVKNERYEALQLLIGWLKKHCQKDAAYLEKMILNWKDEEDNTILHISTLNNNSQAVRLLVKTRGMCLNKKNLVHSTALDIAKMRSNAEIVSILRAAGARHGSRVTNIDRTRANKLRSKITIMDNILISYLRMKIGISEEHRGVFLVVATLVATAAFQIGVSPPGGVFQADAGDFINNNNNNNVNTTNSLNSTATAILGIVGKSVMFDDDFLVFGLLSLCSLLFSTLAIYVLLPGGPVGHVLFFSVFTFICCYTYSIVEISPTSLAPGFIALSVSSALYFLFVGLTRLFRKSYERLQYDDIKWEAKRRNGRRGNRW